MRKGDILQAKQISSKNILCENRHTQKKRAAHKLGWGSADDGVLKHLQKKALLLQITSNFEPQNTPGQPVQ